MPSAVRQTVDGLRDDDEERRGAACQTLVDIAQRLGDHIVPEILSEMRSVISFEEDSVRIRNGACAGLGKLVFRPPESTTGKICRQIINAIHRGLSDELV